MAGLGMYEAVAMGPRNGNSWAFVGGNQTLRHGPTDAKIKVETKFETLLFQAGRLHRLGKTSGIERWKWMAWLSAVIKTHRPSNSERRRRRPR